MARPIYILTVWLLTLILLSGCGQEPSFTEALEFPTPQAQVGPVEEPSSDTLDVRSPAAKKNNSDEVSILPFPL